MSGQKTPPLPNRAERPLNEIPGERSNLVTLMDDILALEAATHPNGDSRDRAADAATALTLARILFERLAGWAVATHAGAAIEKKGNPTHANQHEIDGAAALQPFADITPEDKRAILLHLSRVGPFLPKYLGWELYLGLEGLSFGEVEPFLAPAKGQRADGHEQWRARLRAIEHVSFLRGRRETEERALEIVAAAYGQSDKTLDSWGKRLPERLGRYRVRTALANANRIGATLHDHLSGKSAAEAATVEAALSDWGPDALKRDGDEYQRIQGKQREREELAEAIEASRSAPK